MTCLLFYSNYVYFYTYVFFNTFIIKIILVSFIKKLHL